MISTITITIDHARLPEELANQIRVDMTAGKLDRVGGSGNRAWSLLQQAVGYQLPHEPCVTISHTTVWCAGWNRPGYATETPAQQFDSWEDAVAYLIDELEKEREKVKAEQTSEVKRHNVRMDYDNAIRRFNQLIEHPDAVDKPTWVQCGSYTWWVAEEQ